MKMTIFLWEFQYILIISSAVKARLGSLHDPNNCICKGISILVVNQWSGLVSAPPPPRSPRAQNINITLVLQGFLTTYHYFLQKMKGR